MATIETRLAALERRWPRPEAPPIYFLVFDIEPVGWRLYSDPAICLMREPGEAADVLRERAAAAARAARPGTRPVFFSADD